MKRNFIKENSIKKIFSVVLIAFMISLLNLPIFSDLKIIVRNIVTTEPIKNLVSLDNNALTVFLGYNFLMKDIKPNIAIPFDNYTLKNGVFYFSQCSNMMLKNGAEGIIENIGYQGKEKYIEILHDGNIKSVYVNVDVIGVNTNLKVKKGDLISTIQSIGEFKFYLTYNDEIVDDFIIENGEIIWKN